MTRAAESIIHTGSPERNQAVLNVFESGLAAEVPLANPITPLAAGASMEWIR